MSTFLSNFDPLALPNPPQGEPREIRAGDTVKWARAVDNYPPSQGFTLSYTFLSRTVTYQVNGGMVTVDGENYAVTIPAATTAAWTPGTYRWQGYIADGVGNRYTVAEGVVNVLPNLQATSGGFDDREPDEIILDNINAMILAKSTQDVESYRLFERELHLYTWKDVLTAKSVYEARVRNLRISRGEKLPNQTPGVVFNHGY